MAVRLHAMGHQNYANGFQLTMHEHLLQAPLTWKRPRLIFVNLMSDLFHKDVPVDFILKVLASAKQAWWHQFQILTKRSGRLLALDPLICWPDNVWMGVSIENMDNAYRLDDLRKTRARTKFLSLEPLLGPLASLNLEGIHWVVVGGESGPRSRVL